MAFCSLRLLLALTVPGDRLTNKSDALFEVPVTLLFGLCSSVTLVCSDDIHIPAIECSIGNEHICEFVYKEVHIAWGT